MAKKFFAWKDKDCKGKNIEWIEFSGAEFFEFIKKEENKSRRFIRLLPEGDNELDDIIIEATEEQFKEWEKEKDRKKYIYKYSKQYEVVSESTFVDEDGESLYDRISNELISLQDTVEKALTYGVLYQALKTLNAVETEIIDLIYFQSKTEQDVAAVLGIKQQSVNGRKIKILKKLKNFAC